MGSTVLVAGLFGWLKGTGFKVNIIPEVQGPKP